MVYPSARPTVQRRDDLRRDSGCISDLDRTIQMNCCHARKICSAKVDARFVTLLRYKDVSKRGLKKAEISPESRESTAGNRNAWGACVSHGAQTAEDNRNIQSTARRASQKVRAATPSTFLCNKCGKDGHSRVGLYSHSRSANGPTECCMLYHHLSRWTDAKKKVVAMRYVCECMPLLRLSITCGL